MAKYEELIDDFELEKRIRTIPEDMDLSEYIKQRGGVDYPEEEKADGGAIGIEVLFEKKKNGGRIGFDNGGQTAPAGTFTLTDYVNFLNAAGDFDRLYDKGEEVVGEAGEFVEQIGDKEYDDYTGKELIRERELGGQLENLEDEFAKTEDDYYDRARELPEDEEAMGAYARQLINDLNQRDVTLNTLAEIAGLKKGGRVGYAQGGSRRSKYDSTGGGLASSSKSKDISPGPGGGGRDDKPVKIIPPFKLPKDKPVVFDGVTEMLTKETLPAGALEQFYKMNAMLTDPETGKSIKHLQVETPTNYTFRRVTPDGITENDIPQRFGAPQSLSVDPYSNNIIGSDLRAEVGKQDIQASKMKGFKNMDYDTYKTIMDMKGGTKITPFEFEGLKEGTITEPGTFTAADGARS
jgi:hypothetical protein